MSETSINQVTTLISRDSIRRRNLILLWASLFVLAVADGRITEYLISHQVAREWNPILFGLVGDASFLAIKAFGTAIAILILWDIAKRHYLIALVFTCFFLVMYAIIVFWNLFVLYLGFV